MIKLIASDLDGTLLNKNHNTDWFILNTIDRVLKSGRFFVVATGRAMMGNQFEELFGNRAVYRILNNGSLIVNNKHEVIYEKTIDQSVIEELLDHFPEIMFDFITKDKILMTTSEDDYLSAYEIEKQSMTKGFLKVADTFLEGNTYGSTREEIINSKVVKINCRVRDNNRFVEFINNHPLIVNNPFSEGMFEITHRDVNKASALKFLLKEFEIEKHEVATFGDGGNDIELLSEFEYSFAPSSGGELAKSAAKTVIGHNKYYSVVRKMREIIREGNIK